MDQKIVDEVTDTLLSGWITTGPKTKRFENEISEYTGAKKTVCFNSATAGIELVLRWYGVGEGDEVIIPAYTYCATANVVIHCGATPVMVDTLPNSFNLDPAKVKEAITERTKVVVPVDISGYPCNYDEIMAIIKSKATKALYSPRTAEQKMMDRIMLMADSAHGFGAVYQGKKLGSVADGTAFSFHAVKNLTTAEGGAVCLNMPEPFDHEEMYRLLSLMSLHGQSKDALSKMKKGAWRYDVTVPGYKCNMTDIQAAIGLVELSRYDSETLPRRKDLCARYDREFANANWAVTPKFVNDKGSETSYHLYQLRINGATESDRDAIIQYIAERDIAVNVHFIPLPMLTAYRERGYRMEDYPNAFAHYSNEISLPLFYNLKDEEVTEVANAVKEAVQAILNK